LCRIKRQFARGLSQAVRTCGRVYFGIVGPSLWFSLHPERLMDRLFGKKPKKSLKYSQRDVFLGIPTNIAAGPLGFQAELNIAPKGERDRFIKIWTQIGLILRRHQMKRVAEVHRLCFGARLTKVKSLPRRKPPPPVLSTSVTPTTDMAHQVSVSILAISIDVHVDLNAFPHQRRRLLTLEMEKLSRQSRRAVRVDIVFVLAFLLTHTSCEKRHDRYRPRIWWNFFRCSNGGFGCIRSSQSHPGRHLCHLCEIRSTSMSFHSKQTLDGPMYRG